MKRRLLMAAGFILAATLLWIVLYIAYRASRPDASSVALATVLIVAPPTASYYVLMGYTQDRLPLHLRILCVYFAALLWLLLECGFVSPRLGQRQAVGEYVSNFILFPVFGIASWFAVRSFHYQSRLAGALRLRAQTEVRLQEAQLAPHTLFNMMDSVYSVLLADRKKAIPLFLSMSEALRHVVDHTRKRWVPLHDELEFIDHYAALERARNPERVIITVEREGDIDVPVPPMLLAPLFENAVKYGRFPDGTLEITVSVSVGDNQMRFEVVNRYGGSGVASGNAGGIGQANVRNRLGLFFPHRSSFRVSAESGVYRVIIIVTP